MQKRFTQPDRWKWGSFTNKDGASLRTGTLAVHAKPRANIILLTGLSEFSEKYFEFSRMLSKLGYNIYTMDWRGQGGSDRYLQDKFKRHSLGFEYDERDLVQFTKECVPDNAPKAVISHSMGALPSMMALINQPGIFKAMVPLSPFYGFQHPLVRGKELLFSMIPFKKAWRADYIPGGGPWLPRTQKEEGNRPEDFSSDPVKMQLHDQWMTAEPRLRIGDVTINFVQQAAKALVELRKPGMAESLTGTPFLVITAGRDGVVNNKATFNMVSRLPLAEHLHLDDAKHEILMEDSEILRPVVRRIHNFLKAAL